jgi:pimeloyl-ACP methyl ester carboxylesterase
VPPRHGTAGAHGAGNTDSRAVGHGGARVGLRTSGSGPETYVLIHGIGVSSRYFRPLAAELARTATVHTIDLPGHGVVPKPKHALSVPQYAEAVWAALAERGVGQPVLVGHSMGAQIAVEMASPRSTPGGTTGTMADGTTGTMAGGTAEGPHRLSAHEAADSGRTPAAVVLLGPTNYPAERSFWRQAMRLGQDTLREPLRVNWIVFSDYLFRCGLPWYLKTVPAMLGSRIEDAIGQVPVPVVVVRGAGDPIVPAAWATAIARLAPRGTVAEICGESHVMMYRSAAAVAALCRAAVVR